MWLFAITSLLALSSLGTAASDEPPKQRTLDELRAKADRCAGFLSAFGTMQQAWCPDGLDKADRTDITGGNVNWPPAKTWSWRVAVLPGLEEAPLYARLHQASDGFKVPGTLSDNQLDKRPDLKREVVKMPEWLTLPRWRKETGKTVYRRIVFREKPALFVVVESSELVPWYSSADDLEILIDKPLPKMGGNFSTGFFALCGDGKVRFLPRTLTEKEVRKVLTSGEGVQAIRANDKDDRKEDIAKLELGK